MPDDNDEGRIKDKLIRSKQEWAKEGRLLTGRPDFGHVNRLPPGQKEVKNWPVLDLGVQPNIRPRAWRLTVDGLVENPMVWTLEEFMALPQEEFVSDIHCVTQWSRYDNHWRGVSARHLWSWSSRSRKRSTCIFHSYDGYTTNVTREVFEEPNVLLAAPGKGKPLEPRAWRTGACGDPDWYFWKSAKWVTRIEFAEDGQARLLGGPRLSQRRRSVEGRPL